MEDIPGTAGHTGANDVCAKVELVTFLDLYM